MYRGKRKNNAVENVICRSTYDLVNANGDVNSSGDIWKDMMKD